jgi:hypothetical protein
MASEPKMLTREEFASLLTVGRCAVFEPSVVIPTEHSDRLIALGADAVLQLPGCCGSFARRLVHTGDAG